MFVRRSSLFGFGLLLSFAGSLGCGKQETPSGSTAGQSVDANPKSTSAVLVDTEPADAKGVGEVRKDTSNPEVVTVVGRVGGDTKPFVDGLAAFMIVDPAIKPCPVDEGCPTPWDYCCDVDKTLSNRAMIKVVDADGQAVEGDARELLGIKELSTVVVRGKANRDDKGNLTVLAQQVFVREK